ncbi:MAG: tRNA (adenosine(37)-N6)-threonylcarbamoyltransferase complex dimerization subunit type 1 TsaB [Vicinamibacterales bacterium]
MIVLALDTSTPRGSVSLRVGDRRTSRFFDASRTVAEQVPVLPVALLAEGGLTLRDVDRFAVVSGPGGFTGLRVGMATVQGFALAAGRLVLPVPTLDALVIASRDASHDKEGTMVLALMDGQRGELFSARYRRVSGAWRDECVDAPVVGGWPRREADWRSLVDGVDTAVVLGGGRWPDAEACVRLGDHVPSVRVVETSLADAIAGVAGRALADDFIRPHAVQPTYVRRPDAELARDARATDGRA